MTYDVFDDDALEAAMNNEPQAFFEAADAVRNMLQSVVMAPTAPAQAAVDAYDRARAAYFGSQPLPPVDGPEFAEHEFQEPAGAEEPDAELPDDIEEPEPDGEEFGVHPDDFQEET